MAAVNAVLKIRNEEPFILQRNEAYIGVLIDDLVTKLLEEPYRMFTSRAEFRLLLRQDNPDLRLMEYGYQLGLIDSETHADLLARKREIENAFDQVRRLRPAVADVNPILERRGTAALSEVETVEHLLKRPELSITDFASIYPQYELFQTNASRFWKRVQQHIQVQVKYDGFLKRQEEQVAKMREMENVEIPAAFPYEKLNSISTEGREKLQRIQPRTLGQASRILGVSPSDVAVMMVYLNRKK